MKITLIGQDSGQIYSTEKPIWHGINQELLDISGKIHFDQKKIKNASNTLWRYFEALPINDKDNIVSFDEGLTPLINLKLQNGINTKIKCDYLFPTGSYKDRGASVLMSKLKEWNVKHIVQDSSGNAGAAIAAYAAKAGIPCDIFLPNETPESKVAQIQAYGANIIRVNGNRKQTAAVTFEAAQKSYYASHSFNPFFFQGTKTFAYEICEQLSWKSPDVVVLPAGNGTLLLGCYIGFKELAELGIIKKIPKLIAVQSQNCSPLVYINENPHFDANLFEGKGTIAEGIAIPNPVRLKQMLHAVIETNGEIITVSDIEIAKTWKWLASNGHFIEPTSAATIAGLNKFTEGLSNELNIVSVFTGSGLKSIDKIQKILSDPSL